MIRKKALVPFLVSAALMATTLLTGSPAHAGGVTLSTDGGSRTGQSLGTLDASSGTFTPGDPSVSSGCGDALDPSATNSRDAQVFQSRSSATYTGNLDIKQYGFQVGKKLDGVTSDPGFINGLIIACGPQPSTGADLAATGYSDYEYYFVFQECGTGTCTRSSNLNGPQNSPTYTGFNCSPTRYNDLGPTTDQRISAFRYAGKNVTCERALDPQKEINETPSGQYVKVQSKTDQNNGPFTARTGDHWYEFVDVDVLPQSDVTLPPVATWSYGNLEEFSAIYTSIDPAINVKQLATTPNHQGYAKYGTSCKTAAGTGDTVNYLGGASWANAVCVRIPYHPRIDLSPDDDLLLDEARVNDVVDVGDTIRFYAVSSFGTRTVGLPFPVCPFSPNYPNNEGNPVSLGAGYPQNLPGADGGKFCRQGFVGLLSGIDWAPNNGFEGRELPRSPSWRPNPRTTDTNWAQCQYPLGSNTFGATAAPVLTVNNVDANQDEFWVSPSYQGGDPVIEQDVPGTGGAVPVVEIPEVDPVTPTVTGKNVDCGYGRVDSGLHYLGGTEFFAS